MLQPLTFNLDISSFILYPSSIPMLPEQQQRILGYFIEEARDHLNTIEQGLLNLQSTLNDPEMINEVFRAAHSIKGGAAMLGLSSIQHTSHRLEDCFKVLKENPIQVDQKLESLFLGVSDTLKALLENLSGPFGLSEETANTLMSETEPVFCWLNEHLELLVQQGSSELAGNIPATEISGGSTEKHGTITQLFLQRDFSGVEEDTTEGAGEPGAATVSPQKSSKQNWGEFQTQVLQTLREMLQLFKQQTTPESRQNLQECCHQLVKLGESWNLPNWCSLCQATANAIANPENTYLSLAKIVITEIKQAQELVLQGTDSKILVSQQLQALLSLPKIELSQTKQPTTSAQPSLFPDPIATTENFLPNIENSITSLSELSQQLNSDAEIQTVEENNAGTSLFLNSFSGDENDVPLSYNTDSKGPEVGIAELNTLADLFEGETPELDETWQQEEILDINTANKLGSDIGSNHEDADSDLADLLSFDEDINTDEQQISHNTTADLNILFGDNFLEKENKENSELPSTTNFNIGNFSSIDLDFNSSSDEILREFSQASHNTWQPPIEIASQDIVEDLLELELDTPEKLSTSDASPFPGEIASQDIVEDLLELELDTPETLSTSDASPFPGEISPQDIVEDLLGLELDTPETLSTSDASPFPGEIASQDIVEDLLGLELDTTETLSVGEVSQPETETIANVELSTHRQSSFDDLFIESANTNLTQETTPSQNSRLELNLSHSETLSLDNLFAEIEENTLLSPGESETGDLFDILSPNTTDIADITEEKGDFWNEEFTPSTQQEFAFAVEQDIAKELEESLLTAAAERDFYGDDGQPRVSSPTPDFVIEDFNVTILQTEQAFDLIFTSDDEHDLFTDFTPSNSITSSAVSPDKMSLIPESPLQSGNLFEKQTPETLAFIPEFTNQPQETESSDSPQSLSKLDLGLFDTIDENSDQNLPVLFEDVSINKLTYIQLDNNDYPGENLLAKDNSFEIRVDENDKSPDLTIKETANQVAEPSLIDGIELSLVDDLLAEDTNLNLSVDETDKSLDLANTTDSTLETANQVAEPSLIDGIELSLVDELLAEDTNLNLSVDETDKSLDLANTTDSTLETANQVTEPSLIDGIALSLVDDLLAEDTNLNLSVDETDKSLDLANTTDSTLETANQVAEPSLIDGIELSLIDELLADDSTAANAANPEELLENQSTRDYTNNGIEEHDLYDETAFLLDEVKSEENTFTTEENAVSFAELELPSTLNPEDDNQTSFQDEFADLEALLSENLAPIPQENSIEEEDFSALEALLGGDNEEETPIASVPVYSQQFRPAINQKNASKSVASLDMGDEFNDLEKLLAEADKTISHSPSVKSNANKIPRPSTRRVGRFEETMKVPVKQLDDMSNLVGELVVNRNTLEQDHERLRQSLDNLLIQVQQLSDVGARMQELYERSLLESSLLASRKNRDVAFSSLDSNTDRGFSELEMDRFTPFHTLSQEMIEMIVRVRESASDIDFVTEETERVARQFRQVTTQLQEGLTRARMVPFSQAIDRLRRGVRDNAIKYGKQVELQVEGGDTLIDKMILDHLTDPLTHMLNNAIAHGIETPEVRQAAGKPPVGEITIRAFHQGNQTVISVGDDGAGIDPERVKAKALKLGMITANEAKTMKRVDVYDLLFQSGFSIKDQADEISGRGVGMDVVRSEISEIRGTVNTDSKVGKGTTFTIRLPLTLSICKALCCVSDKARIAFPMDGVEDTLDIPVKNIQHNADGQSFIPWRDTVLPFRPLKELLAFNRHITRGNVYGGNRDDDMVSVVVVRSANSLIALQIDLVLSEQEIVIKQFEGPAPKPIGVAGATVLGDGRIMPIADVLEIMDIFQGRISKQSSSNSWQQKNTPTETPAVKIDPTVLIVDDSITVRELLSLTFNKAGYRVEQARDGQEAWDKLRSGLPCDIVFCDIEMPRCDGLELLSRIQKDSNLNHLPIAMLTSRGADKHRQMAIQLGASGYFTKPYLEEALLEAAVRMLKGEKLV